MITIMVFFSVPLIAQEKPAVDSSFIKTYPDLITARIFFSKKYTSLKFDEPETSPELIYRPNTFGKR
jgi:hypothetical protein